MEITPDSIAARFAPPLTGGMLYARQLQFSDGAYQLAERALDALPRGHHLDQAVTALEAATHWVCAGLAAVHADEAAEQSADEVPYILAGPALTPTAASPAEPASAAGIGRGPDLDVSLWRTCLTRGALTLWPLARLVALVVAESADAHGHIADADQPEIEGLCLGTGLPSPDVLHALEELATGGWISRHTDGSMTRYQLRLPVPNAR